MAMVMPEPKPFIKPSGPKIKAAIPAIITMQKVVVTSTRRKKSTASKSVEVCRIELVDSLISIKPIMTPEKLNIVSA